MKKTVFAALLLVICLAAPASAFDEVRPDAAEREKIRTFLAACADIASFDIKSYDYDTLFKYVLYTHKNFTVLTDIEPQTAVSSTRGFNRVTLVNGEFIDFVMENVFAITPEKPPFVELTERGWCYMNGFYYYTGGFSAYFSTEVGEIENIYGLDSDTLLVVFGDVYTENGKSTAEKSYAIIRRNGGGYSLLRLGMGAEPPSEAEAQSYAQFSYRSGIAWNTPSDRERAGGEGVLLPILLLVCAGSVIGLILSLVLIFRTKK